RRYGRQRARGRQDLARQAPLGDRLSDQGVAQARGEEILIAWRTCSLRIAALSALAVALVAPASAATDVERVVSPLGIEAWLVHSPTAPLIAIDFAFRGGSSQDPADKPAGAALVAGADRAGRGHLVAPPVPHP